jgi:hypothetical protein
MLGVERVGVGAGDRQGMSDGRSAALGGGAQQGTAEGVGLVRSGARASKDKANGGGNEDGCATVTLAHCHNNEKQRSDLRAKECAPLVP